MKTGPLRSTTAAVLTIHSSGRSAVVHPDDLPSLIAAQQRALATGEPLELELRVRRADGTYRWFHMRSRPLER